MKPTYRYDGRLDGIRGTGCSSSNGGSEWRNPGWRKAWREGKSEAAELIARWSFQAPRWSNAGHSGLLGSMLRVKSPLRDVGPKSRPPSRAKEVPKAIQLPDTFARPNTTNSCSSSSLLWSSSLWVSCPSSLWNPLPALALHILLPFSLHFPCTGSSWKHGAPVGLAWRGPAAARHKALVTLHLLRPHPLCQLRQPLMPATLMHQ
ncbi:unnamed protein product [Closterium sp. Yama58-4]|nr:unnamed protein product [Closterium sp. Yama58-4]